jgi:hypothetical protein
MRINLKMNINMVYESVYIYIYTLVMYRYSCVSHSELDEIDKVLCYLCVFDEKDF